MNFLSNSFLMLLISLSGSSLILSSQLVEISPFTASDSVVQETEAELFLFNYFGIPPQLRNAPRDVQQLLNKKLLDWIVGSLIIEPIDWQFNHSDSTQAESLSALALSGDSSHACLGTGTACRLLNLNKNDTDEDAVSLVHIVPNNVSIWRITFKSDDTRIIICEQRLQSQGLGSCYERNIKLVELALDNFVVTGKKVLLCPAVGIHNAASEEWHSIAALSYLPNGNLAVVTYINEVYILDCNGNFIGYYYDSPFSPLKSKKRVNHVIFHPNSSTIFIQVTDDRGYTDSISCAINIFSCESGTFSRFINPGEIAFESYILDSISRDGTMLVFQMFNADHRFIAVLEPATKEVKTIAYFFQKYWESLELTDDGHFLIYTPTKRQGNNNDPFVIHRASGKTVARFDVKVPYAGDSTLTVLSNYKHTTTVAVAYNGFYNYAAGDPTSSHFRVLRLKASTLPGITPEDQSKSFLERLCPLFEGRINLKDALFILFVRVLHHKCPYWRNESFDNLHERFAREANVDTRTLKLHLAALYSNLNAPLKRYVFQILGSPDPEPTPLTESERIDYLLKQVNDFNKFEDLK